MDKDPSHSLRKELESGAATLRAIAMACMSLLAVGCASRVAYPEEDTTPIRSGNDIGTDGYRAAVGDMIDIFVLEDDSFSGSYIVRPSGDLILPKAGRVQVAGQNLDGVEASVQRVLQANQLTSATVIADPVRRGGGDTETGLAGLTVYLSGSVVKTGRTLVPFVGEARVSAFQAITDSGGFAAFANKKKSYVLRRGVSGGGTKIPVNFEKIEKGEEPDLMLQDGDTIVVPQKLFGL